MNLFNFESPKGLNPSQYIATLIKVARSDGIDPTEQSLLHGMAANLGVNLKSLPDSAENLSALPWAARATLFRDAVMLSKADGTISNREELYLKTLAEKLGIAADRAKRIQDWVNSYDHLLDEFQKILG